MRRPIVTLFALFALLCFPAAPASAQAPAAAAPALTRPTLAEVRAAMAVPSSGDTRGRQDSLGYALHVTQMAKAWELAEAPPAPDSLDAAPPPGRRYDDRTWPEAQRSSSPLITDWKWVRLPHGPLERPERE